jgi:pyrroloquinoline quinone (PQQ) biosynthesis protein C
MNLPDARGPLSASVRALLSGSGAAGTAVDLLPEPLLPAGADPLVHEDLHLALWMLYELHYRGFDDALDLEWDPATLAVRARLETVFEDELRRRVQGYVDDASTVSDDVTDQVLHLVDSVDGPSVAQFLHRHATREQVLDFLAVRSLYHLKESDPHSFVLPRIDGPAKTALAELQYDEYGAGRPEQLHARLFGDALEAAGLDRGYGAYVERTPGHVLAVNNVMSLLGLHRRLRGAALGHLAAFEVTSSVPCRKIAAGIERVGLPATTAAYFHEHVEADAVHEQVALRDICGGFVAENHEQRENVLLGVAACLYLDVLSGAATLESWAAAEPADQRMAS